MNNRLNILLVDDSLLISKRLQKQLMEIDCVEYVFLAGSFLEAQKTLKTHTVHIALLDINLPGKNGIDLLKFISRNYPFIQCVMITNQEEIRYRKLCNELGCVAFLDKSRDLDILPELIENLSTNCKSDQLPLYISP